MKNIFLSILLLAALVLSSCNSSDFDENNHDSQIELSDVPVKFTSTNSFEVKPSSPVQSRIESFRKNEILGMYMVKENSGDIINNAFNLIHVTTNPSTDTYWKIEPDTENDQLYYPSEGNVDFLAYHPYNEDITSASDKFSIDLLNLSNDFDNYEYLYDLLFADTRGNGIYYNKSYTEPIRLDLKHQLAYLDVEIRMPDYFVPDESFDFSEYDVVTLTKHITYAEFDFKTAKFTDEKKKGDLVLNYNNDNKDTSTNTHVATFYFYLLPQELDDSVVWKIKVPDPNDQNGFQLYEWQPIKSNLTNIEGGKKYKYIITLKSREIKVEGRITNWDIGSIDSGIAQ